MSKKNSAKSNLEEGFIVSLYIFNIELMSDKESKNTTNYFNNHRNTATSINVE